MDTNHDYTDPVIDEVRTRSTRKVALTILALGAASAAVVFGSLAAWTAQTTNDGNTVTGGQLTLGNSIGGGAPILATNISNVVPGQTGSDNVTITNNSSGPLTVTLTQDNVTDGLSDGNNDLKMTIFDTTTGDCVYPAGAGACPALDDTTPNAEWDGSAGGTGNLVGLALPGDLAATWAAAEAHTFTVTWEYTDDGVTNNANNNAGPNTAAFDLTWDGA